MYLCAPQEVQVDADVALEVWSGLLPALLATALRTAPPLTLNQAQFCSLAIEIDVCCCCGAVGSLPMLVIISLGLQ